MPLESPPPLGHRVPDLSHAISVQMPTWQDMCDMALGDPRVKNVQRSGYPRSFLHRDVEKLAQFCRKELLHLSEHYSCLVFSNFESAKNFLRFLRPSGHQLRVMETQSTSLHGFRCPRSSHTEGTNVWEHRIYAISFPKEFSIKAMSFWRLTGTGVSSRFAAYCLENAVQLEYLDLKGVDDSATQQCWTNSHEIICRRILDLLQRASIDTLRAAQLSTHDIFLYESGMSAIYHVQHLLLQWRGAQSIVFGFPYELTLKMLQTYGPGCIFHPFGSDEELQNLEQSLENLAKNGRPTQALWCECPSNPLLRTPNLRKLRTLADRCGFVLVVDDTIGSFANVDLLGIADIIISSLTKSFSGYSNVMAGSVILNPTGQHFEQLSNILHRSWSNDLFVEDAIQLETNSRDFLQRVNQINKTTSKLVKYFKTLTQRTQSNLTDVYYPEICWSANNYRAQMRRQTPDFVPGYGGVFTVEFSSVKAAAAFFNASNVHKGPSLGANLTLMQPYVQTVFFKEKEWAAQNGVRETILRISVGLEDCDLLLEAFHTAMGEADKIDENEETGNGSLDVGSIGLNPLRSML